MWIQKESRDNEANKIGDEDEDDIIVLGENTKYPTMKWRFPDTVHCPKTYCSKYFSGWNSPAICRKAAMLHYCKEHAKNDLLCIECNKLISMSSQHNLIQHYQRKHPSAPIPLPTTSMPSISADTESKSTDLPASSVTDQIDNNSTEQMNPANLQPINKSTIPNSMRRKRGGKQKKSITFADVSINTSFFHPSLPSATYVLLFLFFMCYSKEIANIVTPSSIVADESMNTDPAPNVATILEIDLSQDDDDLWGLNGKNDITAGTSKHKVASATNNKKQPRSKNALSRKASDVGKTSSPIRPSLPLPPPLPLTTNCNIASLYKRQRTRSTGIRSKVSGTNKKVYHLDKF